MGGRVVLDDELGLDIEDRLDPVAHGIDDSLEVELLGERLADLVDDRQLGVALLGLGQQMLRLIEQARVFQRHAHARSDRRYELLIGNTEGVGLKFGQREHPDHPIAGRNRHPEIRLLVFALADHDPTHGRGIRHAANAQRRSVSDDVRRQAFAHLERRCGGLAHAVFNGIRELDRRRLLVDEGDGHRVHVENLGHAIADGLDDPLKIELPGQRTADLVDDRQFGRALLGLGQQPLRLIEEARIFQRHAHARGDRAHRALVGFCEQVRPGVTDDDNTNGFRPGHDRDAEPRLGHPAGCVLDILADEPSEGDLLCGVIEPVRASLAEDP